MNIDSFIYLEKLRKFVQTLPGVTEGLCYGTLAYYVGKKLIARLKEDGITLVVYSEEREKWLNLDPSTFYITAHYQNYPYVLVSLTSVSSSDLETVLTEAWKTRAGKKRLKEWKPGGQ